jgi:hypothetical protein
VLEFRLKATAMAKILNVHSRGARKILRQLLVEAAI